MSFPTSMRAAVVTLYLRHAHSKSLWQGMWCGLWHLENPTFVWTTRSIFFFLLPLESFSTLAFLSSKTFGVSFKESSVLFWGIGGGGSCSIDKLSEGVGGFFNGVFFQTWAVSYFKRSGEVSPSTGKESSASFWVESARRPFEASNCWVVGGEESLLADFFWEN